MTESEEQPYILAAPLRRWEAGEGPIAEGLTVKPLDLGTLRDLRSLKRFLSQHDLDALESADHWLCYEFLGPWPIDPRTKEPAQARFDAAQYAVQLLAPIGRPGLVLIPRLVRGEGMIESVGRRLPLNETVWGRVMSVPQNIRYDLPAIIERIEDAFRRHVIRIQNPIYFLEHGLQATNPHIRVLLWTTGLDALLMAGNAEAFADRLHNLLDADTLIFPPGKFTSSQPTYKVGDVSRDLYQLRSDIAHGREIRMKFREQTGFKAVDGGDIPGNLPVTQYRQVLEECAVFLLAAALRKVLTLNLFDVTASESRWRQRLRTSF